MSATEPTGPGNRIRRLSAALIDQIAAGEVVERPASVVKELVENALDAGAERVRVEVRAGGRDWIAVGDDGCGMSPREAVLALERHATSKIAEADDLRRIGTFGFRGEALPAIASVSRLRLRTRPRGAETGCELRVEVGRLVDERETAGPEGTRIEVADLFAGVPARRKFLKSVHTEWGHIADWVARAALAQPAVHFDVRRDDRPAIAWPGVADPLDRIAAVLGEEDAAALVGVEREEGRAGLRGFASRPDRHRAALSGIYLFVNGRPVRDRVLQHALVQVYRDLLPRGRFPSAVLFLRVPPEAVDVNVHPAKWEVRFADPRWVHRLVHEAVRDAIAGRGWIAPGAGAEARPDRVAAPPAPAGDWRWAPRAPVSGPAAPEPAAAAPASTGRLRFGDLRLLGQLLATYLLVEASDRLLLVDQHAAHERVLFERLRDQWRSRRVESQGLLVPRTLELAPAAAAALAAGAESLDRLGFEVEPFGEGSVAVRAVPALLAGMDPAELVRGLAEELAEAGSGGPPPLEAVDRVFATLACHAARRKGDALDPREQRALLEALDEIPWAPSCPHGRPVAVPIDLAEIERRFGRR